MVPFGISGMVKAQPRICDSGDPYTQLGNPRVNRPFKKPNRIRKIVSYQKVDENDTRVASMSGERIPLDQVLATAGGT